MPIVRQLINRVSFKVDSADKANAEKTFASIKGAAAKVLTAIAAITGAGATMFTEAESNRASVNFFSRSKEEADKLLQVVKEIRGEGVISERERLQAAAIISQLVPDIDDFKAILPVLRDISIAQPKLDFPDVVKIFAEFVKTGDIESLRQLGAVGKDLAEQLVIAGVNVEDSIKGQVNRAELLTQEFEKQKERIRELAELQKNTLLFGFRQMTTEASNFTLKFGKETSPIIKEVVGDITGMLNALNESEGFWNTVRGTVELSRSSLKGLKDTFSEIEEFFSPKEIEKREKTRVEGFKERRTEYIQILQEDAEVGEFPIPKGSVSQDKAEAKFREILAKKALDELFPLNVPGEDFGESRSQGVKGRSIWSRFLDWLPDDPGMSFSDPDKKTIEINGKIVVEGKNLQGADMRVLGSEIRESILGQFKEANRNIIAKSGGDTGIGGAP